MPRAGNTDPKKSKRNVKSLPECMEVNPENEDEVRCSICMPFATDIQWLKIRSITRHMETSSHQANTELWNENDRQRKNEQQKAGAPVQLSADGLHFPEPAQPRHARAIQRSVTPTNATMFSAGEEEGICPRQEAVRMERELELLGLWREFMPTSQMPEIPESGLGSPSELISNPTMDSRGPEPSFADIQARLSGVREESDWQPFQNKTMFLMVLLTSMPRLRLSDSHLKMILWVMREVGGRDIPSLDSVKAAQKNLATECVVRTHKYTSDLGNIFHMNDVGDMLGQDLSNPEIAKHLRWYPEEPEGSISEVWQASHWREEVPRDLLTPVYVNGGKQFYIDELAADITGKLFIPLKWVTRKGKMTADAYPVDLVDRARLNVCDTHVIIIDATTLRHNYYDVEKSLRQVNLHFEEELQSYADRMPNPLRKVAQGDDLYCSFIKVWGDDVSGARSKQYNLHNNIYCSHSNIPGKLLQQEFFVRFCGTSPDATVLEQMGALTQQIEKNNAAPPRRYNAATGRYCRNLIRVENLPADNPMQSETTSHIGLLGNHDCRKCPVGGSAQWMESDEGFHSRFITHRPRLAAETKAEVLAQLDCATHGVAKTVKGMQTQSGIKDKIAQHWIKQMLALSTKLQAEARKERNVKKRKEKLAAVPDQVRAWLEGKTAKPYNRLLDVPGLDVNRNTPGELLHLVLLGSQKYAWGATHAQWPLKELTPDHLFAIRLDSTNIDSLSIPPIRASYMIRYRNGLIGKHFRTFMQVGVFHLHGICDEKIFEIVKAAGFLGSLLWYSEIENMDEYLADLKILIDNLLDRFADYDPQRVLSKPKFHILVHLPEDIQRFGPAARFATEVFECFNAVFRLCSVFSNRQAASRDIASQLANLERMKHIVTGGFWINGQGGLTQASHEIRSLMAKQPKIQQLLGWTQPSAAALGSVKTVDTAPSFCWDEVAPENRDALMTPTLKRPCSAQWRHGKSLVAQSGDICKPHTFVVFELGKGLPVEMGRISGIFVAVGSIAIDESRTFVAIQRFRTSDVLHEQLEMPILTRAPRDDGTGQTILTKTENVRFSFNVQHDCTSQECLPNGQLPIIQGREESGRTKRCIKHVSEDDFFIINLHALHNASLIRRVLPRALTAPRPCFSDRLTAHAEIAVRLRSTQNAKRAAAQVAKEAAQAKKGKSATRLKITSAGTEGKASTNTELASGGEEADSDSDSDSDALDPESEDDLFAESTVLFGGWKGPPDPVDVTMNDDALGQLGLDPDTWNSSNESDYEPGLESEEDGFD